MKLPATLLYTFYVSFAVLSMLLIACSKVVVTKEPEIPAAIQALIDSNKDCTCDPYIDQYIWRSKTVFVVAARGPFCDTQPMYYDENGAESKMPEGYTLEKFRSESTLVKNVWTCKP
jgi:hypothetical protein